MYYYKELINFIEYVLAVAYQEMYLLMM